MVVRDNALVTQLCRQYGNLTGMAPRINSTYGTATMGSVNDNTDLTSEGFAPTALSTLTPYEYGTQFLVTDQRRETDPMGIMGDAATELGLAVAAAYETALVSDFGSFTAGTTGSAGGTLTMNDHFKAMAYLRAQNAPRPWVAVYHPWHWYRMVGTIAPQATANIDGLTSGLMQNYFMGNVGGCLVFTSTFISSGTAAKAGMFSRDALALDVRRAPRLERERNASLRAWELNMTTVYAHGVWRPKFGVQMIGTDVAA